MVIPLDVWTIIMKKALFLLLVISALQASAATHFELAEHYAPVLYHDTNDDYGYKAEHITNVDYDGDWNGLNNWNNLYSYATPAFVYYDVSETTTHWFISYYAFHPRDDGPIGDAHENDFEGALLAVRKNGSEYGQLQVVETLSHDQFYQYTNDVFINNAHDNVDGNIYSWQDHPKLYIQANGSTLLGNGHGWHNYEGQNAPGGDGIVYFYTGIAEQPGDASGNWANSYGYALLSMDELWDRKYSSQPFASFGVMAGNDYGTNKAKMPWKWDDSNDGPAYPGAMWADPAHLIDTHLKDLGNYSRQYVSNDNYNYSISISEVRSQSNRDFWGGKSDIYVKVWVNGVVYWNEPFFKKNNAGKGKSYYPKLGSHNATSQAFDGNTNTIYLNQPAGSEIRITVYDSDSDADDYMGEIKFTLGASQSRSGSLQYTSNGQARVSYAVNCVQ